MSDLSKYFILTTRGKIIFGQAYCKFESIAVTGKKSIEGFALNISWKKSLVFLH